MSEEKQGKMVSYRIDVQTRLEGQWLVTSIKLPETGAAIEMARIHVMFADRDREGYIRYIEWLSTSIEADVTRVFAENGVSDVTSKMEWINKVGEKTAN